MSPTQRPSTIAGLRRAVTPAPATTEAVPPVTDVPQRPRPEKPVRFTLDLDRARHKFLKNYATEIEARGRRRSCARCWTSCVTIPSWRPGYGPGSGSMGQTHDRHQVVVPARSQPLFEDDLRPWDACFDENGRPLSAWSSACRRGWAGRGARCGRNPCPAARAAGRTFQLATWSLTGRMIFWWPDGPGRSRAAPDLSG